MSSRKITIIATTGVIALVVALIFIFRGNGSSGDDADSVLTPEQSAHRILQHPVAYDQRSLSEYAEDIRKGKAFTVEENSMMIVTVESAFTKFGQELEYLSANDDAADSWNTLTEYARSAWPNDVAVVTDYLSNKATLNSEQVPRMQAIVRSIDMYSTVIRQIEDRQLDGRRTGLSLKLSTDS